MPEKQELWLSSDLHMLAHLQAPIYTHIDTNMYARAHTCMHTEMRGEGEITKGHIEDGHEALLRCREDWEVLVSHTERTLGDSLVSQL